MNGYDKSKFNLSETFNNGNGKSSGSGLAGLLLTFVGAASFLCAMMGYFLQLPNTIEVMGKIIIILSLAAALLGLRKFVGSKDSVSVDEGPPDHDNHDDHHDHGDIILESPKKV